ncbi:hypothetical protein UlMin_037987 [Ulmus minor]
MFLHMGSREICFGGEIHIFGVLHLIVLLGIILGMDKILKKTFVAASIKFPSALFSMFCIFSILINLDSTVLAAATSLMNFFQPTLLFIQRWLPLFYVPPLVVLPLSVQDILAADGIKIGSSQLATLCVTGFTAIARRKIVKIEIVDAEPMAKTSPFSTIELWYWSGILLISFVGALFYHTMLGTSLPSYIKKIFHPTICCALSADLATMLYILHLLVILFCFPLLYTRNYLTKVLSNPGASDVLMGFLGSVILSFAFSMFKQRELFKRHVAEVFTSIIASTIFSLYSTVLIERLVGLEPSLNVSILPRCITVALALSIVSLFEVYIIYKNCYCIIYCKMKYVLRKVIEIP